MKENRHHFYFPFATANIMCQIPQNCSNPCQPSDRAGQHEDIGPDLAPDMKAEDEWEGREKG